MMHVPIHNQHNQHITFSILDSRSSILDSHVSKLKRLYLRGARISFQGSIESFVQLQLLCEILYKYVASCSLFLNVSRVSHFCIILHLVHFFGKLSRISHFCRIFFKGLLIAYTMVMPLHEGRHYCMCLC